MKREEIPVLAEQLNSLAEVYGNRQLSQAAIRVWVDTLKEFPLEKIMGLLIDWPKSNAKMPTPSQCWQTINEREIETRERVNAEEKKRFEREMREGWRTPEGARIATVIRGFLAKQKKRDPKQWARDIIEAHESGGVLMFKHPEGGSYPRTGEQISPLQLALAREALAGRKPVIEREPGQDEEELFAA